MQYYNVVMHSTLIKTIWVLIVTLFFSVQGVAQSYVHDCDDHMDDEIICDVYLAAEQQNIVVPPLPITIPFSPPLIADWDLVPIDVLPNAFDSRAPPPRGPPIH